VLMEGHTPQRGQDAKIHEAVVSSIMLSSHAIVYSYNLTRPISRFTSEMLQDRTIVTMEYE